MRVSPLEKKVFTKVIAKYLQPGQSAELRLYGSRIDENKKGGDFDLLLLLDDKKSAHELSLKLHHILAEIKRDLGDQGIDLKIIEKNSINDDPFLFLVYKESILLEKFIK